LALNDAPIIKYGNVTKVVSQLDAMFAVGLSLDQNDLERFFQLVPELFGERDPALDIPQKQWWMARVLGKSPSCSRELLSGLGDALCILSLHGDNIFCARLDINCAHRVGLIVRALMHNADEDRWLSIRGHLRAFAEASPNDFLVCLEEELLKSNPLIRAIMGTTASGIGGECLRTNLLWALEMLAWHPQYFVRVVQIIFGLRRLETEDNWSNSPRSTAHALFRAWLPATAVSVDERIAVLHNLSELFRESVIDVCISLLPQSAGQFASRNIRPEWRDLEVEVPVPTYGDVTHAAIVASHLLLNLSPFDKSELKIILKASTRLDSNDLSLLVEEVKRWAEDAHDEEKAELRNDMQRYGIQRVYQAQNDESQIMAFHQLEASLEPEALTARNRWLFDSHYIEWHALEEAVAEGRISYEERAVRVQQRRQDAMTEIKNHYSKKDILQFALTVKCPALVAQALVLADTPPSVVAEWISFVLAEQPSAAANEFLQQLLLTDGGKVLPAVVNILNENDSLDTLDKRSRFVKALPGISFGWRVAEAMGEEFVTIYWNSVALCIWKETPNDEIVFGVRKLIEAKRPRSAFSVVHYWPDRIEPDQWVQILEGIAKGEESEGRLPDAYAINEILQHLDKIESISETLLLELEMPFLPGLCSCSARDHKRVLAVHRDLMRNPTSFVQLLRWCYRRRDGAAEPDLDLDPEQKKFLAGIAFHVLESWNLIPGGLENGEVDRDKFVAWVEQALHGAAEVNRKEVAEVHLAELLGRVARHRSWEQWLPGCVLEFLDRPDNGGLLKQLGLGVRNARGITCRSPFDGGAQERVLADKYRELAAQYSVLHSRVAAQLILIAESYEIEARRQDEEAAIDERWHP